jgi:hypothetical protein
MSELEELEAVADDFDAAVLAVPDISHVCTASDWAIAGQRALKPDRFFEGRRVDGYWLLWAVGQLSSFRYAFQPLEFDWGFGLPLIGPDPRVAAEVFAETLGIRETSWQIAVLSGIPSDSMLLHSLVEQMQKRFGVQTYDGCHCVQADLSGGRDGFLRNRSSKFRSNLNRAERQAQEEGITFEVLRDISRPTETFLRALAVEEKSWKYEQDASIFLSARYEHFYMSLAISLARKGRLRMVFAQKDGEDIGYVMGGVLGQVYRGFQLGYSREHSNLSIGNLVQWAMIQALIDEGATIYDLGMDMDYKRRWGEKLLELTNLVVYH